MQSRMKALGVLFAAMIVSLCLTTAGAQEIRFTDFSSIANLQLNGSPHQATWQNQGKTYNVLRLTDGFPEEGEEGKPEASSVFFTVKQPVSKGFTTYFEFAMHNPPEHTGSAEGLVFLIQNSSQTDSTMGASGAGLTALGAGADPSQFGAMGYAGIYNSLAIEFDIAEQSWDPTGNHVAIQTCGKNVNTPVHLQGTYTIGNNQDVTSCLLSTNALTSNIQHLADGNIHQVVIEYRPGGLQIWLDPQFIQGTHTPKPNSPPILKLPYKIDGSNALVLDSGKAWVGFAASQSFQAIAQDVLAWEFTPHTLVSVQQKINNNGQTNTFTFGGHDQAVTYPAGSNPTGLLMTVTATPTDPTVFFNTRLKNTNFANEACVVYLETGGNCMVYSVTCQDPNTHMNVTCPVVTQPAFIALSTSYFTTESLSDANADYLKADPIGSNNWVSICNPPGSNPPCYDPNTSDGTTSGKGQDLSDLVATFKPTTGQQGEQQPVAEPPKPVATEPQR